MEHLVRDVCEPVDVMMNTASCSQSRGRNSLKTEQDNVRSDLMAVNSADAQRKGASLNPGVRNNFLYHLH